MIYIIRDDSPSRALSDMAEVRICLPERERDQRKVLVQKVLNTIIGMGGERRDLVQFELEWHQDPIQTASHPTLRRWSHDCDQSITYKHRRWSKT